MVIELGLTDSGKRVVQCLRCNTVYHAEQWDSCPHCSLVEQNYQAGKLHEEETRWIHIES